MQELLNNQDLFPLPRNCNVMRTCVKVTCVNKKEATLFNLRTLTFTFTRDLQYITSFLFTRVRYSCVLTWISRVSGNPPYRGLLDYTDREESANEKRRKESGGLLLSFLSPLKQESDACRRGHTLPDEFSTARKIWPDTSFIRDFELLDVWFLCTVKVVPCEQKT